MKKSKKKAFVFYQERWVRVESLDDLIHDIIQVVADRYVRQERIVSITLFPRERRVWFQEHHFEMISLIFYPIYQILRQSIFGVTLLLFLDMIIPPAWDDYSRVSPISFYFRMVCKKIEFFCAFS